MVKKLILIFSLMLFAGCGVAIKDKQVKKVKPNAKLIVPIYSQKISIMLPGLGWKPVYESNKKNAYRIEFIPKEENSKDWKNLISIQGFKNIVKNKSLKEKFSSLQKFSFVLKNRIQSICPKNKLVFDLIETPSNKKIYLDAIIGCSSPTKIKAEKTAVAKGEIAYYRFLAGKNDIYIIHKAVRGNEMDITLSLNTLNAKEFFSVIKPIKICKYDKSPVNCQEDY